jgi:hypothetical protein
MHEGVSRPRGSSASVHTQRNKRPPPCQGAGAAAIAAPLLRPEGAEAALSSLGEGVLGKAEKRGKNGRIAVQNSNAPYITIFDARAGVCRQTLAPCTVNPN